MNRVPYCACLALVLFTSSCTQQSADTRAADESSVRDTDAQWAKTAMANDLDGTVSYYSDDASILPPNAPIATGKQAIRAVWATMLSPDTTVSWQVSKAEVARSGELAYVMGTYQIAAKNPRRQVSRGARQNGGGMEKAVGRKVEDSGRHL